MQAEWTQHLSTIVGLLLSLSVASERLVEIVKGMVPWLNEAQLEARQEGRRRAALQILAVLSGIATAGLAAPVLAPDLGTVAETWPGFIALGLLASGGSGLWNAILGYVLQVKELKKQEVKTAQSESALQSGVGLPDLNLGTEQVTSNECYDVGEK